MRYMMLAAGLFACALTPGIASAGMVKTLCQVEISEEDQASSARQGEAVGFIKRVDGMVKVLRPTADGFDEMDATVGMDIYATDAVTTGGDGGFDAIFTDNSTISGVADTCVEISKYVYNAADNSGEFRMRLGRGVVTVAAGSVAKSGKDRMSVKIRNDTNLAVSGTRIVIRAE